MAILGDGCARLLCVPAHSKTKSGRLRGIAPENVLGRDFGAGGDTCMPNYLVRNGQRGSLPQEVECGERSLA